MADAAEKKDEPVKSQVEARPDVASDPEEDDLSDLDDVLDEFAAVKIESPAPAPAPAPEPAPTTSAPGRPPPEELLMNNGDEFAKQLQAEMESLLGQKDFQKQFEDIVKEMGDVVSADPASATAEVKDKPTSSTSTAEKGAEKDKGEPDFQETIRKTMERMQASGEQASAAAASSDGEDMLAQMLKEMESGGFGGEGNDEDFSKILMGMMEQLTNKEILYEPMKELSDKFPLWMEENRGKVTAEDLKRYEEQQTLVTEITARFQRTGYSDSNTQDREYIVERMQKMQAAGSPPPDLVGEMNAAQEALGELDQGCPTQ
ncbi:Pex19 protein family-domain-containing protein [Massariosphaeria phaeospora]|uniref:Pex19 protein family-domain-containing protein n=1 Tax=Massariosphaeria phaeospora TaxID=100035 RepID=A0A7C8MLW9_9PLEO|nr:Pex19 protein family-domain-containing protein [Massariosphaeria phaeospora]